VEESLVKFSDIGKAAALKIHFSLPVGHPCSKIALELKFGMVDVALL
jgi:hypothetical protein